MPLPSNFLIFVPQGFPWRILRRGVPLDAPDQWAYYVLRFERLRICVTRSFIVATFADNVISLLITSCSLLVTDGILWTNYWCHFDILCKFVIGHMCCWRITSCPFAKSPTGLKLLRRMQLLLCVSRVYIVSSWNHNVPVAARNAEFSGGFKNFEKGGGGNVSARSSFIANPNNYMPFTTAKIRLFDQNFEPMVGASTAPFDSATGCVHCIYNHCYCIIKLLYLLIKKHCH